jgi:hypothetical protein
MARHKRKFNNASEHNGLALRHPALLNIDSMELIAVAEAEVPDTPPIAPARRYSTPSPAPEKTASAYRQRRERPINNSELPPLDWMTALDKYVPLKTR